MLILDCEVPVLLFYTEVLVYFLLSSSYTHMNLVFMCVIKLYIFTVIIIRCMNSLEV